MPVDLKTLTRGLIDKVNLWVHQLGELLPNFVAAILVMVASVLAAKLIRRLVHRGLNHVTDNRQIANLLARVAGIGVVFTGLVIALGLLQLDKTVTSALAGVGVIGLALGFAFQDIAANFVSGVIMAFRRPFRSGDLIKSNDYFGTVVQISLRTTRIRTLSGEHVLIPNKDVLQSPITNYTDSPDRRIDIPVGVTYGENLEQVREVTRRAIEELGIHNHVHEVEVFFTGFGSSSIDLEVRFWLTRSDQKSYLAARSQAIIAIKAAYDANDITIPFPIRTLDFGPVGGETLTDVGAHLGLSRRDK